MTQMLTPRIRVCVYALCEVQTGSVPESLQTRRPYQTRPGGNRSGYHLEPKRQIKTVSN